MRARHRHFNPRFAGAGLVLDSRYINQSNNTAVSSWEDRSGNSRNANQSNTASQPTFQTNQSGGNGVVRFDGSNDQLSLTSNLASVDTAIYTAFENGAPPTIYYIIGGSNVGYLTSFPTATEGVGVYDGSLARTATFSSGNIRNVFGVVTTSRSNIFVNSREATYNATTTPAAITISTIGNRSDFPLNFKGDICNVSLFTSSLSNSLRRKLEHAAAFSFKIACS